MTSDIAALVDFYVREKELPRERVLQALESAFLTAYRKMVPGSEQIQQIFADINTQKGIVRIKAIMTVVPDGEVVDAFNEVPLSLAQRKAAEIQPGDTLTVNITPSDFGRIAVQTARQTMQQSIRKAEQEMLMESFKDRAGDIVTGTVRRFDKGDIIVDIDKFEGIVPARQRIPGEDYAPNDKMRFYICEVRDGVRGPEVILSRSHPNLVRRLFESEVVEIADHTVEIREIARDAGYRTKLAVYSADPNVDPVGACVGMRGSRVKSIVNELNHEKIDILEWTEDKAAFVESAIAPVKPMSITVDEQAREVRVIVEDDREVAKAIGRKGQNARLTARLISTPSEKWDVKVRAYDPQAEINQRLKDAAQALAKELEINDEIAFGLITMGGTAASAIVGMPAADIAENLNITPEEAEAIISRARAIAG